MIKYSIRFILWEHDKNSQGKCPIYLRIIINRETKYLATGIFIIKKNWDSKNELIQNVATADLWNADLSARKQKIIKAITERQIQGRDITAGELKELFSKNYHNFFDFADSFIREVKGKRRSGTLENYRKHLLKLELYHGSRLLSFEEITHDYLINYEEYLRKTVGENYIHALWKTLKTFFNAAIKRGIVNNYPFKSYENPKYTAPDKDYLTLDEISRVEKLADETSDPVIKQTAIYFLLGCFTGLRISDWYQFDLNKHVGENEILLRATKNNEWVTMPLHARLKRNLKRMHKVKLEIEEPTINRTLKDIAKKIESSKRITTHTGRHSFAVTMCLNRGISSEVAAELMGITLKTFVDNYSQITKKKIFAEAKKAWKNL